MEPTINDLISKQLSFAGQKVIHIIHTKVKGVGKQDRYVVFSDQSFSIFKKDKKLRSTPWIFLMGIVKTENSVTLKFSNKKSYVIFPSNINEFLSFLFDVIQRLLLPSELDSLNFGSFHSFTAYPNPLSVVSRIKQKVAAKKFPITPLLVHQIMEAFTYSRNEIDISRYDLALTPFIIDALPLAYDIKTVRICNKPEIDAYAEVTKLMKERNRFKLIEVVGAVNASYDDFIETLVTNKPEKLFSLSFIDSEFEQRHLDSLKRFVDENKMKAIEFHNATSPMAVGYMIDSFLSNLQLTSLNLDKTAGLDIPKLAKKVPDLILLSLQECKLDISEVIPQLSSLTKLRGLNLSGNRCLDSERFSKVQLPESLISLYVNKVKWERDCFKTLFNFRLLKLSVAHADIPADEWNKLFDSLIYNSNNTLAALIWDGNRLHLNFFKYLRNHACLDYLSLNYCFSQDHPEYLSYLVDYLQNIASPVRTLSIRGNEKFNLGIYIGNLVDALYTAPNLSVLDINGQRGGDQCLIALLKRTDKIRVISCDGMKPANASNLMTFLSQANQAGIAVSYPFEDISSLVASGKLSKEDAQVIFEKCGRFPKRVKSQPPGIEYDSIKSHFDDAFQVFQYHPNDQFPRILKKKELLFYTTAPPMTKIAPVIIKPNGQHQIATPVSPHSPSSRFSVKSISSTKSDSTYSLSPFAKNSMNQIDSPLVNNNAKNRFNQHRDNSDDGINRSRRTNANDMRTVRIPRPLGTANPAKKPLTPRFVFEEEPITFEVSLADEDTIIPPHSKGRQFVKRSNQPQRGVTNRNRRRNARSAPRRRNADEDSDDYDEEPRKQSTRQQSSRRRSPDNRRNNLDDIANAKRPIIRTRGKPNYNNNQRSNRVREDDSEDDPYSRKPPGSPHHQQRPSPVRKQRHRRVDDEPPSPKIPTILEHSSEDSFGDVRRNPSPLKKTSIRSQSNRNRREPLRRRDDDYDYSDSEDVKPSRQRVQSQQRRAPRRSSVKPSPANGRARREPTPRRHHSPEPERRVNRKNDRRYDDDEYSDEEQFGRNPRNGHRGRNASPGRSRQKSSQRQQIEHRRRH